jgi:chaperone modulatory protein CbpM
VTRNEDVKLLKGLLVEEELELSLAELCRACELPAERILELVEYGVIEPQGRKPAQWRFHGVCVRRVRRARRLETDLGLNVAGVALVLDLLEEVEKLRARVRRLEG